MILVLLADGFEEIEALTPVDMLRRAGLNVKTCGITSKIAIGAHGISVICDILPHEAELDKVSMLILPGGMPGATNLDESEFVSLAIDTVNKNGGRLAAICAAPLVLGRRGLLEGKRAVCYPGFESELRGATVCNDKVVTDANITTAKGMGAALEFSKELISLLVDRDKSLELSRAIME